MKAVEKKGNKVKVFKICFATYLNSSNIMLSLVNFCLWRPDALNEQGLL